MMHLSVLFPSLGTVALLQSMYGIHRTSRVTVMILSFWTDMPVQTVQTQIRLLLEEQSDQGLHYVPFRLHHLDSFLYGRAT